MRVLLMTIVSLFLFIFPVHAETLTDRLASYPNWQSKPALNPNFEEVAYPAWMAGNWICESTLIDMVAPLPKVTTPGFEGNRKYLNEPVSFEVRFGPTTTKPVARWGFPTGINFSRSAQDTQNQRIVVDRVFNGLSIARAYLGEGAVRSVVINPNLPNEQLTTLKDGLELLSVTTGHQSETPEANLFLTSEFFQQIFRGTESPFLNQVETTTKYQYFPTQNTASQNTSLSDNSERNEIPSIVADQYTAIYLSPQDPNYFEAIGTPVALYRYRLELKPVRS
jgi:hypothetical protein